MTKKKERGPGAPKGRRDELLICAAVVDGKLVSKKYAIKDQTPDEDQGSFPIDSAIAEFKAEFGKEPDKYWDHLYVKKSALKTNSSKKTNVSRNFEGMTISSEEAKEAIYNGWKGMVFETVGNDQALFVFTEEINPSGKKKSPPNAAQIDKSELKFIDSDDLA